MFLLLLMAPAPYDLPLPECVVVADEGPQVANAPAPILVAQNEVQGIVAREAYLHDKLTILEHYLSDQKAVAEGRAPKGWVQPAYEEYAKPGAPASFLP